MIRGGEVNRHNGVTTRLARRWRFLSWLSVPCHLDRATSARRRCTMWRCSSQAQSSTWTRSQPRSTFWAGLWAQASLFRRSVGFRGVGDGRLHLGNRCPYAGRDVDARWILSACRRAACCCGLPSSRATCRRHSRRRLRRGLYRSRPHGECRGAWRSLTSRAPEGTIIGFSEPPPAAG